MNEKTYYHCKNSDISNEIITRIFFDFIVAIKTEDYEYCEILIKEIKRRYNEKIIDKEILCSCINSIKGDINLKEYLKTVFCQFNN